MGSGLSKSGDGVMKAGQYRLRILDAGHATLTGQLACNDVRPLVAAGANTPTL
jgi:hypothetical protein